MSVKVQGFHYICSKISYYYNLMRVFEQKKSADRLMYARGHLNLSQ